jgi:hypothetical protein
MDIDATRRNKKPRPLSDSERMKLEEFIDAIHYSARYEATLRIFAITFLVYEWQCHHDIQSSSALSYYRNRTRKKET